MKVDVATDILIDRPVGEVSAYAADPDNAPRWYENIESVSWKTPPPLAQGSLVTFTARFLGRRLEYTYEFVEVVPDERVVMRTQEGPFPMETTYTWERATASSTHMTLRNRGTPSGFKALMSPFMTRAVRRANRRDLRRLKAVVEANAS